MASTTLEQEIGNKDWQLHLKTYIFVMYDWFLIFDVFNATFSNNNKKSVEGTLWPYIDMRNIYIMEKMGPGGSMS
jgi:hypothetical protein